MFERTRNRYLSNFHEQIIGATDNGWFAVLFFFLAPRRFYTIFLIDLQIDERCKQEVLCTIANQLFLIILCKNCGVTWWNDQRHEANRTCFVTENEQVIEEIFHLLNYPTFINAFATTLSDYKEINFLSFHREQSKNGLLAWRTLSI